MKCNVMLKLRYLMNIDMYLFACLQEILKFLGILKFNMFDDYSTYLFNYENYYNFPKYYIILNIKSCNISSKQHF